MGGWARRPPGRSPSVDTRRSSRAAATRGGHGLLRRLILRCHGSSSSGGHSRGSLPGVVFLHVACVLLFFIAHGTSMSVAFRLKREREPGHVRALLDLSSWTLGIAPSVAFLVGLVAGIAAGIMGGHFGHAWIWIARPVDGRRRAMTQRSSRLASTSFERLRAPARSIAGALLNACYREFAVRTFTIELIVSPETAPRRAWRGTAHDQPHR